MRFLPFLLLALISFGSNFFFFNLGLKEFLTFFICFLSTFISCLLLLPILQKCLCLKESRYLFGPSITISFLLNGFLAWYVNHFIGGNDLIISIICLISLILVFLYQNYRQSTSYKELIFNNRFNIFFTILIFILSTISYSIHPELYWGEKPMDLNFIHYFGNDLKLPLTDPWISGSIMHYYYLGHYFLAKWCALFGVKGELCYSWSLSFITTCFFCVSYSLFNFILKSRTWGLFASIILTLGSNLKSFILLFTLDSKLLVNYVWESTRVFSDKGFAEFPVWSFLFADLHAHVIALPFTLTHLFLMILALERRLFARTFKRNLAGFYVLYAFSFGAIIGLNAWDFLILTIVSSVYFLFTHLKEPMAWFRFLLVHLFSLILFSPIFLLLNSGRQSVFRLSQSVNSISSHFYFHGLWWLIIFSFLLFQFLGNKQRIKVPAISLKLGFIALLLMILSESFVFMDRINTIFKVNNWIYILWGLSALFFFRKFKFFKKSSFLRFYSSIILLVFLIPTFFILRAHNLSRPYGQKEFGLKGGEYLTFTPGGQYRAIKWLRENVDPSENTMIEKYSNSFDHRSLRFSMHTGIPIWVGWSNHIFLRGALGQEIERRKQFVDFVYLSNDALRIQDMLIEKAISYVIVGPFERSSYPNLNLEKFKNYPNIFKPVFSYKKTTIYEIGHQN